MANEMQFTFITNRTVLIKSSLNLITNKVALNKSHLYFVPNTLVLPKSNLNLMTTTFVWNNKNHTPLSPLISKENLYFYRNVTDNYINH